MLQTLHKTLSIGLFAGVLLACEDKPPELSPEQAAQLIKVGASFAEHLARLEEQAAEFRLREREAGRGHTIREPDPDTMRASSYEVRLQATHEGTLVVFSPDLLPYTIRDEEYFYLLRPGSDPERLDPAEATALTR